MTSVTNDAFPSTPTRRSHQSSDQPRMLLRHFNQRSHVKQRQLHIGHLFARPSLRPSPWQQCDLATSIRFGDRQQPSETRAKFSKVRHCSVGKITNGFFYIAITEARSAKREVPSQGFRPCEFTCKNDNRAGRFIVNPIRHMAGLGTETIFGSLSCIAGSHLPSVPSESSGLAVHVRQRNYGQQFPSCRRMLPVLRP